MEQNKRKHNIWRKTGKWARAEWEKKNESTVPYKHRYTKANGENGIAQKWSSIFTGITNIFHFLLHSFQQSHSLFPWSLGVFFFSFFVLVIHKTWMRICACSTKHKIYNLTWTTYRHGINQQWKYYLVDHLALMDQWMILSV